LTALPVVHTSHPVFGYLIEHGPARVIWAPEFWAWPEWADGVDLMFADAAGWDRPIRFTGGVGGHAAALDVCRWATQAGVRRLGAGSYRPSLAAGHGRRGGAAVRGVGTVRPPLPHPGGVPGMTGVFLAQPGG
jgi:hypothetical protein